MTYSQIMLPTLEALYRLGVNICDEIGKFHPDVVAQALWAEIKETPFPLSTRTNIGLEKKEIYDARTTVRIVATTPVFMALLGWLVLKEGLNIIKIIGILLVFSGLLLVSSHGNIQSISVGKFGEPGFMMGTS